jgi:hypothetical protein
VPVFSLVEMIQELLSRPVTTDALDRCQKKTPCIAQKPLNIFSVRDGPAVVASA